MENPFLIKLLFHLIKIFVDPKVFMEKKAFEIFFLFDCFVVYFGFHDVHLTGAWVNPVQIIVATF
jgi:hypothetical protein